MIEYIMEKIAFELKIDPIEVRLRNMVKDDDNILDIIEELKKYSNYHERKVKVELFNKQNRWRKRSLRLMPLKYNITYVGPLNSIVSIFSGDGSVAVTHAGIEMGQGLNTKVAQVCAYILGVPLEKITIKPSSGTISPNSMNTGGSYGSECIAFATMKACKILLKRLEPVKKDMVNASWEEIVEKAFILGIDLQATYSFLSSETDIKPYKVYASCVLEIEIDILTGIHDIKRVDLLEDTGRSLSPEIDVGQVSKI